MKKKSGKITEVQKATEWVRFARTNHAIYRDESSEAELTSALKALEEAMEIEE